MRLTLHTIICCCVFTTVLPLVKGTTGEFNTSLKKRFREWSQNRMKRDVHNNFVTANEHLSDNQAGRQEEGDAKNVALPARLNLRLRRSPSSKCALITCAYHDLLHQLYHFNHDEKQANAPDVKISSKGYGRRRRSLQRIIQLIPCAARQRRSTEAASKASCLAAETEDSP
ncbi:uncharacterized protein V6R79_004237 [Siganus canaliculatus]